MEKNETERVKNMNVKVVWNFISFFYLVGMYCYIIRIFFKHENMTMLCRGLSLSLFTLVT